MKVLIWATTFGADLWALTHYLDSNGLADVRVVMNEPKIHNESLVARMFPLRHAIVERADEHSVHGIPGFDADITVMDSWVPSHRISPKGFMLWHGYGWMGLLDKNEALPLHEVIANVWGDPCRPNENFRLQCFGPVDVEYRSTFGGFAAQNCVSLGAASHDYLRKPLDRSKVASDYSIDVANKKTVLLAPTWHYGAVFEHWGTDEELLETLFRHVQAQYANLLIRLHDSFRYEGEYRERLETLVRSYPDTVMLKYRDKHPHNFIDMQVADALVTNFSSIANLFYATRRPTIHIYPVESSAEQFMTRRLRRNKVRKHEVDKRIWKYPVEDNGGFTAGTFQQLLDQITQALADPDCCLERTESYLERHMHGGDGHTCERILAAMRALHGA